MGSKPPVSRPPIKRRDPLSPEVSGVPDAEDYLQEQLEARERRKAETERRARKEARPKATYDLPLSLIEAIQTIADEEQVSRSDVAAWALADFVTRYRGRDIDLREHKERARSLRCLYKLVIPGKW